MNALKVPTYLWLGKGKGMEMGKSMEKEMGKGEGEGEYNRVRSDLMFIFKGNSIRDRKREEGERDGGNERRKVSKWKEVTQSGSHEHKGKKHFS